MHEDGESGLSCVGPLLLLDNLCDLRTVTTGQTTFLVGRLPLLGMEVLACELSKGYLFTDALRESFPK